MEAGEDVPETRAVAIPTGFAPAERAEPEWLEREVKVVVESPLTQALLKAVDGWLLILNEQRQVLAANDAVLTALGEPCPTCIVGARPGEVLQCVNVPPGLGGCGTSRVCQTCGAAVSILASQRQEGPVEEECLLTMVRNGHTESREFRVRATSIHIGPHPLTVLVMNDISAEKRRQTLERVFFHDILNTIGGLKGWTRLMEILPGEKAASAAGRVVAIADTLTTQVREQQQLVLAERGELELERVDTGVADVFGMVRDVFAGHGVAEGKRLEIVDPGPDARVVTDVTLLGRILVNMVKNAFEASAEGDTVRLWYERQPDVCLFKVWNPGVIPFPVAARIFQRSFSTKKSPGRGLGTYSMRLFGERYMGGKVNFTSREGEGTTFFLRLPDEGGGGAGGAD